MRGTASRPFRIRFRVEGDDGFLVDVDTATTVPVVVKNGDNTTVASGVATREDTGVYYFTVPVQTQLDILTATATATVDSAALTIVERVRLVDRRIAPLSVLRAYPALADLSTIDFLDAVDQAEDWLISCLNFSPVMTGERRTFRTNELRARLSVPGIYFPRDLYALSYNGNPYTSDQLATLTFRGDSIEYATAYYGQSYDPIIGAYGGGFSYGVFSAWVSHGLAETPQDLVKACGLLANHVAKASSSALPDRATRVITEMSEIFLSTPDGDKRLTGLPEVDGILARHRISLPFADDSYSF